MVDTRIRLARSVGRNFIGVVGFAAIYILAAAGGAQVCLAQAANQKTFAKAPEAANALYRAIKEHDVPVITSILGARKADIIADEDDQDKRECGQFVEKYKEMRRLVRQPNGTMVLYVGAENWPFPFPLVSAGGEWHFDSAAGLREILFRRIGENETEAIQECRTLVSSNDHAAGTNPVLQHGYCFRSVTPNGGNTTGKLALVAYPAEYRSSGVMTFLVNKDGAVYAKDLGAKTANIATAQSGIHRDSTWSVEK